MKKLNGIFPVFLILAVLSACSTPPVEEMEKAENAVTKAENDADAVTFAPNILVRARDSLARMQGEAEAKRYDSAKNFAAEAISTAERAIAEGKTGAARASDEAASLIDSLPGLLAEVANTLNTAREAQNIDADFDSLSRDLDLARRSFEDAKLSFQANRFQNAIAEAQKSRSMLANINRTLNNAAQVVSRKQ